MTTNRRDLEDHLEIEQLVYRYPRAFDSGDSDSIAEMFVPEAVVDATSLNWRGDIAGHYRGLVGGGSAPRGSLPEGAGGHQMFNHLYSIDGDVAQGVTYCITHMAPSAAKPTFRVDYIRYDDVLVRRDGRWRFLRRQVDIRSFTQPIPARLLDAGPA